ncbi:MAG: cyclic nucleotide-binding domain-containing protein [Deltaproteobacteria bacterium]|nr:cyclic nucleotide-binding domain-containing protein [Deltaproteobacteria bacterium]
MEKLVKFRPQEVVIEEGSKGTSAYIILSGAVEVIKRSGDREVTVATLGAGQVFGEMGLIEDRPRSATVRALTEVKVRCIDREHFNELLKTKPSMLIPIMKSLFERLRQVSDMLAERSFSGDKPKAVEKTYEVIMEGQTEEARRVLDDRSLCVTKFPFLIGRESQNPDADVFYNNDLFIREEKPYMVSRNHLAISNEGGLIWVVDRGSAFGTIVNGKEVGGRSGVTRVPLDKEVNQVVVGPATSRFIFLLRPVVVQS